jgi:hypothetical protein
MSRKMVNSLREYLKESILDPVKEELSPEIWNGEKLKPQVKTHIIKRFESWFRAHASSGRIKYMYLLGSMTGYQYSKDSDLDINVVTNLTDEKVKELFEILPNGSNLPGTEHPINYYVVNKENPKWRTAGFYDLLKDVWVHKENKEEKTAIIHSYRAVIEIARFFIAGLDAAITEYNGDKAAYESYSEYLKTLDKKEDKESVEELLSFKLSEILADLDGIRIARHLTHAFRGEAFAENDEPMEMVSKITISDNRNYSMNNLIWKYIEKLGYIKRIQDILDEKDKWITLKDKE